MKVALGSDHRGVGERAKLAAHLKSLGHDVVDIGAFTTTSVDYPDIAAQVGREVAHGQVERGILLCGTGVGMSIAANKIPGVRAAALTDETSIEMSRRHNNLNVLCLSADLLSPERMNKLVDLWLDTPFDGGERHERRLSKITALEHDPEPADPAGP